MEHPEMQAGAVIVGAGPAGLACALHLSRLIDAHNDNSPSNPISKENIYLLEKGREIGAHQLSGAVMDPSGLRALEPDFAADPELGAIPVGDDAMMIFGEIWAQRSPLTPPPLENHGNYIVSVNRLAKWLGAKVEAAGVSVFTGFAGAGLLYDGGRVTGVRTDDKGVDREGRHKSNFEPGYDLKSDIVVLAEGPRGSLTKALERELCVERPNPQVYSLGVKEIWELPAGRFPRGRVLHTLGWPFTQDMYGGGWIYGLDHNQISLGLMTALEYKDPATDPHNLFQRFKTHPWMRELLAGGEMVRYGAKTVPMGGWYSLPPTAGPGYLVIGDSAGFVNSARLKGIHLAITSGMLAAESVFEALRAGDPARLAGYPAKVESGAIKRELWPVRNFHQGFEHGLAAGMINTGLQMATGGRGLHEFARTEPGFRRMRKIEKLGPPPAVARPDGRLTFDKVTDVFHSGTRHEEDQPAHLLVADTNICATRCVVEYGNPCQNFCPANVYEMVFDEEGNKQLHLNPSNCVHCKTCDIMDPYEIITWVPPEGGGGPSYEGM